MILETARANFSNQNRLSAVRIFPLSGMPLGMMQSNALMRSVATISSARPDRKRRAPSRAAPGTADQSAARRIAIGHKLDAPRQGSKSAPRSTGVRVSPAAPGPIIAVDLPPAISLSPLRCPAHSMR